MLQVLLHQLRICSLGDDNETTLCRPSEENFSWRSLVVLGDVENGVVLEQDLSLVGGIPVQLAEAQWAKGRVGSHGDVLRLSELDQLRLGEVGMMLCQ